LTNKWLKTGLAFYPPSVNSAFSFTVSFHTRSPNGTQPNFAKSREVTQICKSTFKVWASVLPKNGAQNNLRLSVFRQLAI